MPVPGTRMVPGAFTSCERVTASTDQTLCYVCMFVYVHVCVIQICDGRVADWGIWGVEIGK